VLAIKAFGLQLTLKKMAGATEILAQSKQYLTQVLFHTSIGGATQQIGKGDWHKT